MKNLNTKLKVGLISLALVMLLGVAVVYSATPTITVWITGGFYPSGNSYTMWKEGSNYFAKNGQGYIPTWGSGTNATQIIVKAMDSLSGSGTEGGSIYFAFCFDILGLIDFEVYFFSCFS